jgi:hypothetical protein
VLGKVSSNARLDKSVALPRFFSFAVGQGAVHVITYPKKPEGGVDIVATASVPAESARVSVTSGLMWARIDIVDARTGKAYTGFIGRIIRGRGGLLDALKPLVRAAA